MKITIDGKKIEVSEENASAIREILGMEKRSLADVKVGETYFIGDMEFIKFPDLNGGSVAIMKNSIGDKAFDDEGNNFAESSLLKYLEGEVLPKIEAKIGSENIIEFETDLLTADGLKIYGTMRSKISLPTFDYYRTNRDIFEKYKLGDWWWLATAKGDSYVFCVSPLGSINDNSCSSNGGVRPFLIFDPSISVS